MVHRLLLGEDTHPPVYDPCTVSGPHIPWSGSSASPLASCGRPHSCHGTRPAAWSAGAGCRWTRRWGTVGRETPPRWSWANPERRNKGNLLIIKDHPDEKPPWDTTLMRHQPNERPPWWDTTLKGDHSDGWWETTLIRHHPDGRPPWWNPPPKRPGPVCMEKGFSTLPVNATQAVATVAVRIWFGSHAWVTEGPAGN